MSVWIPDKGVCLVTCTLVTLGWPWGTPKMGVDGFAEAWGVRKSRQGANWRAVELFSAQTTYFCQTSCLTHTRTHTHVDTQCAFTVCYSVTAVTLGIFSSCSLCCQTHTPWSSKTGLYRLQPVADCKADLLSVVMLLPHDFIFFLLES